MVTLISSQHFLDESIVIKKMQQGQRWIHISPAFMHDGKLKSVLLDGHHSLAASLRIGEIPCIDLVDDDSEVDLIYQDEIEMFLEWHKNDADWYEIMTIDVDMEACNT